MFQYKVQYSLLRPLDFIIPTSECLELTRLDEGRLTCDIYQPVSSPRVESNFAIAVPFCIATVCDWCNANLAPLSQPIRSKNQTNRALTPTRFPALRAGDMYLFRVLIGSLECLLLLRLVRLITLVLRHSTEKLQKQKLWKLWPCIKTPPRSLFSVHFWLTQRVDI